jgi:TRAP-type C4-dicarboxylate transport system permease small subunit
MFLLFALMGVLLWGAIARAGWHAADLDRRDGQFLLMGYFMIGGAYALQMGSAVRMDLLYGRWSDRTKAAVDAITILALIFYLVVLLWGGIESTLRAGIRRAPARAVAALHGADQDRHGDRHFADDPAMHRDLHPRHRQAEGGRI